MACYLHIGCLWSAARLHGIAHALNKSLSARAAISIGNRQPLLDGVVRIAPTRPTRSIVELFATPPRWSGATSLSALVRQKNSAAARTGGTSWVMLRIRTQADHAIVLLPPRPCSLAAFVRRIGGLFAILADDFLVALEPKLGWRDADKDVIAASIPFRHAIRSEPSSEAIWQRICTVARGVAAGKVRGYVG